MLTSFSACTSEPCLINTSAISGFDVTCNGVDPYRERRI